MEMKLHLVLLYSDLKNFLKVEVVSWIKNTEKTLLAVIPKNEPVIQTQLIDDNRCTYQMIQKELNIASAAIHNIIHEELQMKKLVCRWISHDLTEYQKAERIRICKETLKLLNDEGHCLISKIITGNKMYSRSKKKSLYLFQ